MAKWLRAKGKVQEASLYTPEAKGLGGFKVQALANTAWAFATVA